MLKMNEFTYRLDPSKVGVITLEMTKKSKRNRLIRQLLPVAINLVFLAGLFAVSDEKWDEIADKLDSEPTEPTPDPEA
jgi:hypothetical protein